MTAPLVNRTYVDRQTPINADWLNGVNDYVNGMASNQTNAGAGLVGVDVDNDYADGTLGFLVVKNTSTAYNALKGFSKAVQSQIQAGTYSGDVTATLNSMLATERRVYVPYGTWPISSLLVPSNRELFGDGGMTTLYVISGSLSQAVKNSDVAGGNTRIYLHDFGVTGNTAGNASVSGVYLDNVNDSTVERLSVNDVVDWGIAILAGNRNKVLRNNVAAVKGINSSSGVRAGFLFGATGGGIKYCNDLEVGGNIVTSVTQPYVDGFVFEQGTGAEVRGNRALGVPYTGLKANFFHDLQWIGNRAANCLIGFQSLQSARGLIVHGNTAYQNSGAGFQFNQADTSTPARGWSIKGNVSIDNGQNAYSALYGASGVRYGYAFEAGAGATIDGVDFIGNVALDTGGGTQGRGWSWGTNGTISRVVQGGNIARGHVADYIAGASLQVSTLTQFPNYASTGNAVDAIAGTAALPIQFFVNSVPAGAGVTACGDGLANRGMTMPKAGYLRGVYVTGSAAPTAGSYTVVARKNGADFGSGLTVTAGTVNSREETPQTVTFAAGDVIGCRYSSAAGLLPAATINLDITVEVVFI